MALGLLLPLLILRCSDSAGLEGDSISIERLEGYFPAIYSGLHDPENLVIRAFDDWSRFWDRHQPGNEHVAPPGVDFQEKMVLVVALGSRSTGGYTVEIQDARLLDDGTLAVHALERAPGDGCAVTQALTQPVDAVLVPRSDAPVEFQEALETYTCG